MEKKEIQLAKLFHDTYERLAPEFGYTTREDTREFDENSSNGKLMIAVCREVILEELSKAREEGRKEVLKEVEYALAKDLRYELRFTEIQEVLSKLKDNK